MKWALRLPSDVGDSFINFLVLLALLSGCMLLQHLVSCAVFFFLLYGNCPCNPGRLMALLIQSRTRFGPPSGAA